MVTKVALIDIEATLDDAGDWHLSRSFAVF
jgi:hypothetical protein